MVDWLALASNILAGSQATSVLQITNSTGSLGAGFRLTPELVTSLRPWAAPSFIGLAFFVILIALIRRLRSSLRDGPTLPHVAPGAPASSKDRTWTPERQLALVT